MGGINHKEHIDPKEPPMNGKKNHRGTEARRRKIHMDGQD